MKYLILGASGFLGKSIIDRILRDSKDTLVLFDRVLDKKFIEERWSARIEWIQGDIQNIDDFSCIFDRVDIVLHLISTTKPSTALKNGYVQEIEENVIPTIQLLDICVKNKVKKFVFISSGGTVYGNTQNLLSCEEDSTTPICSYGIHKLMIEKYIYLYGLKSGLDYNIIRLSNPYGPFQNPESGLGAITNFVYKAVNGEKIVIFGDGTSVRDYIYIDDAVQGILNICQYAGKERLFNLGTGKGTTLNEIVHIIEYYLNKRLDVEYCAVRESDLKRNVLNIDLYKKVFGEKEYVTVSEGIKKMLLLYETKRSEMCLGI